MSRAVVKNVVLDRAWVGKMLALADELMDGQGIDAIALLLATSLEYVLLCIGDEVPPHELEELRESLMDAAQETARGHRRAVAANDAERS